MLKVHMGSQKITLLMTAKHQDSPTVVEICVSHREKKKDKHSVLDLAGKVRRQALPPSLEQSEALIHAPLPKVGSHSLLCVTKHSSMPV